MIFTKSRELLVYNRDNKWDNKSVGLKYRDQRMALAGFFANFAVAWLAGGIIGPFLEQKSLENTLKPGIFSLFWGGFSIWAMLFLTKGGKK